MRGHVRHVHCHLRHGHQVWHFRHIVHVVGQGEVGHVRDVERGHVIGHIVWQRRHVIGDIGRRQVVGHIVVDVVGHIVHVGDVQHVGGWHGSWGGNRGVEVGLRKMMRRARREATITTTNLIYIRNFSQTRRWPELLGAFDDFAPNVQQGLFGRAWAELLESRERDALLVAGTIQTSDGNSLGRLVQTKRGSKAPFTQLPCFPADGPHEIGPVSGEKAVQRKQ